MRNEECCTTKVPSSRISIDKRSRHVDICPLGPSAFAKRQQALQAIMKALQTLASTRKCAVVLLSQCATKMRLERGASLIPAVAASVWEQNISTRIALFRDWSWQDNRPSSIFLAGLQKLDGKLSEDMMEHASAFSVSGVSRKLPLTRTPTNEYRVLIPRLSTAWLTRATMAEAVDLRVLHP